MPERRRGVLPLDPELLRREAQQTATQHQRESEPSRQICRGNRAAIQGQRKHIPNQGRPIPRGPFRMVSTLSRNRPFEQKECDRSEQKDKGIKRDRERIHALFRHIRRSKRNKRERKEKSHIAPDQAWLDNIRKLQQLMVVDLGNAGERKTERIARHNWPKWPKCPETHPMRRP